MAMETSRQLLDAARHQGRDTGLPALAVAVTLRPGYGAGDDKTLFEPSLHLEPCPHPVLEAFLETTGATRRGRMSWSVGLGEEYNAAPLHMLMTRLAPGIVMHEENAATARGPKDLTALSGYEKAHAITRELHGTPAYLAPETVNRAADHRFPDHGPARFGAVTLKVSGDGHVLWIKLVTHQLVVPDDLPPITLNLRPAGRNPVEPRPVRPIDAVPVLDWLASQGVALVDPSTDNAVAQLRRRVTGSIIAIPAPGRPALAQTSIGRTVFRTLQGTPALAGFDAPAGLNSTTRQTITSAAVAELAAGLPQSLVIVHPGVADTVAMARAMPIDDDRLRDYQRIAVGRHLSTELGYVPALDPGLGKTVVQLCAMSRKAVHIDRYRGLVIAESNVRTQWEGEAEIWFPEAVTVKVESRSDTGRLAEVLASTDGPVLVLSSYGLLPAVTTELNRQAPTPAEPGPEPDDGTEDTDVDEVVTRAGDGTLTAPEHSGRPVAQGAYVQMDLFTALLTAQAPAAAVPVERADPVGEMSAIEGETSLPDETDVITLGKLLLGNFWHDISADEAEVLRGSGSKQKTALWALRRTSGVATTLTGTPINRGVDDLGELLCWVRNDPNLFHGADRLSRQFNLEDSGDQKRFQEAVGPLLLRVDASEIAGELPRIAPPEVLRLVLSPEELALANAARDELKRGYLELLACLDAAEAVDPGNEVDYQEAREALQAARGAWLGGTTLARMAAADPAALVGSTSAGAALLAGQGLIEAATARPGTKRTRVVQRVMDGVIGGEKILVFTDFATVATGLIADIEAAGIRVGAVLGGGGRRRDEAVRCFQAGELDVLVCTASGERGLNLQRATTVVHYDLPWTPKAIIQRNGRNRRIGSTHAELKIVFPLAMGTIEERVANIVVSRAVEAMLALDVSRGVAMDQTQMHMALGGLLDAIGWNDKTGPSEIPEGALEMTRALVS